MHPYLLLNSAPLETLCLFYQSSIWSLRNSNFWHTAKIHLDNEDKNTPPLSTIYLCSSHLPSLCHHGISALTPTRRYPVSNFIIIFRINPGGLISEVQHQCWRGSQYLLLTGGAMPRLWWTPFWYVLLIKGFAWSLWTRALGNIDVWKKTTQNPVFTVTRLSNLDFLQLWSSPFFLSVSI